MFLLDCKIKEFRISSCMPIAFRHLIKDCCLFGYHCEVTSFICIYSRYDFEQVDSAAAADVMNRLKSFVESQSLINSEQLSGGSTYIIDKFDDFEYSDPIDQSVTKNQVTCFSVCNFICMFFTVLY